MGRYDRCAYMTTGRGTYRPLPGAHPAIGTVGLTLGITPELSQLSRAILIFLMYMGRVGGLTLIFATTAPSQGVSARYPQGKLNVG